MKPLLAVCFLSAPAIFVALATGCADDTLPDAAPTPDGPDAAAEPSDADRADDALPPLDAGGGCTAALEALMKPRAEASTATVAVVQEAGGTALLYVDATAGGAQGAAENPRVYVDLAARSRVGVGDVAARTDPSWDLALERAAIFTNGGQGGAGQGAACSFRAGARRSPRRTPRARHGGVRRRRVHAAPMRRARCGRPSTVVRLPIRRATSARREGRVPVRGEGALFRVQIVSYYGAEDGGAARRAVATRWRGGARR